MCTPSVHQGVWWGQPASEAFGKAAKWHDALKKYMRDAKLRFLWADRRDSSESEKDQTAPSAFAHSSRWTNRVCYSPKATFVSAAQASYPRKRGSSCPLDLDSANAGRDADR